MHVSPGILNERPDDVRVAGVARVDQRRVAEHPVREVGVEVGVGQQRRQDVGVARGRGEDEGPRPRPVRARGVGVHPELQHALHLRHVAGLDRHAETGNQVLGAHLGSVYNE